jgi:hypothetical protein
MDKERIIQETRESIIELWPLAVPTKKAHFRASGKVVIELLKLHLAQIVDMLSKLPHAIQRIVEGSMN